MKGGGGAPNARHLGKHARALTVKAGEPTDETSAPRIRAQARSYGIQYKDASRESNHSVTDPGAYNVASVRKENRQASDDGAFAEDAATNR